MAIISDYQDEPEANPNPRPEQNPLSSSAATWRASAASFSATLDRTNPLEFVERAFQFLAEESDFLLEDSAETGVAGALRAAKEKAEKRKKQKVEEEAKKKVREREKMVEEVVMKDAKDAEKEEDKKSGLCVPNKGNGLDLEKYSWTQTLQEVTVNIPVPKGTKGRFVVCDIKKSQLKVGLKGLPPVIVGELYRTVKPDDCYWSLGIPNS